MFSATLIREHSGRREAQVPLFCSTSDSGVIEGPRGSPSPCTVTPFLFMLGNVNPWRPRIHYISVVVYPSVPIYSSLIQTDLYAPKRVREPLLAPTRTSATWDMTGLSTPTPTTDNSAHAALIHCDPDGRTAIALTTPSPPRPIAEPRPLYGARPGSTDDTYYYFY